MNSIRLISMLVCSIVLVLTSLFSLLAQTNKSAQTRVVTREDRVEVVATRTAQDPELVPAAVEVITGSELRDRGATDLQSALAMVAGVEIVPGGDGGPASAVPAFMGLKEFDAFLLVVDGVPWGGAFNPNIAALSLQDVERIEILRGPAPVMYGATSFVGVIHVVHRDAANSDRSLMLRGGSYLSGGASFSSKVPLPGGWDSRLTVDVDRQGFRDDRTSYSRAHGLFRSSIPWGLGRFWYAVDGLWLDQNPASPHPREGSELSPAVPLDANHNPDGAFLNEHRFTGIVGFDRPAGSATWTTLASVSAGRHDILRGFLADLSEEPENARGLRENINLTDIYVDSHLAQAVGADFNFVAGADYLHGSGSARGGDFEYEASLEGDRTPVAQIPDFLDVHLRDRRDFGGVYASGEWHPAPRLRLDAGIRVNLTREEREEGEEESSGGSELQSNARLSGTLGVILAAWEDGPNAIRFFSNYRSAFKPAAFDFGLGEGESEAGLLRPETSRSFEAGIKVRALNGRLSMEASPFLMDLENLVIAHSIGGLPALMNAGKQRLKGFDSSAVWYLPAHLTLQAAYSFHVARFRDFAYEFDPGVPTQLAGNYLEMSPRHLVSAGVRYVQPRGLILGAEMDYVGSRYLNKRNTAVAGGYASLGASFGYRFETWDLRLDCSNLNDRRDPVAESELGDAQYYLLPARHIDLSVIYRF